MNFTGHGGPAKQGRGRASQAADNNILWCRTLEIHRVNAGVADQGDKRQRGRQRVDKKPKDDHRYDAND